MPVLLLLQQIIELMDGLGILTGIKQYGELYVSVECGEETAKFATSSVLDPKSINNHNLFHNKEDKATIKIILSSLLLMNL